MLKFSKKVDYGLILLSKLRNEPETASAREMAERVTCARARRGGIIWIHGMGGKPTAIPVYAMTMSRT